VLVPLWIARRYGVELSLGSGAPRWVLQLAGLGLLTLGLVFFTASLRRFATEGHGTLAPWDPPRKLVVRGPYRYVRNPMISGVVLVLFGESLVLLSAAHAGWAVCFLVINLIYIPLIEEPQLKGRFGAAYLEYCRHVPRIVPRLRPWVQGGTR
jgi:protein-S-isoprenylcysteine O-methyltransferase Ste14